MSRFRLALAVAGLGLSLLSAPGARADDEPQLEQARQLYTQATKDFHEKQYEKAALGFEAASKLHPAGVALYTAAQAWEAANTPARAADDYARALQTPKLTDSQTERARARLDALEKTLGTVVATGDDGTRVQLDDLTEVGVPARLHGTPGVHGLLITKPDGSTEKRAVTLTAGASLAVDTTAAPEQGVPTPEQPEKTLAPPAKHAVEPEPAAQPGPEGSSTLKTVGFVAAGAGVGALGGAVLLGLSANNARDTYNATPTQGTYDHAKGLESKTNIMFIAGGVLTAAGVGLVIWQSTKGHEQAHATVGLRAAPGALWAEGSF